MIGTQIADTASVAKGSVYCHFKDKEDLFRNVYEALIEDDVSAALDVPSSPLKKSLF